MWDKSLEIAPHLWTGRRKSGKDRVDLSNETFVSKENTKGMRVEAYG